MANNGRDTTTREKIMRTNKKDGLVLLLTDARGIYIPRDFIQGFDGWQGITEWQGEQLQNPDNNFYWDAWADVLNTATYEKDGHTYRLMQDGDLWAYCIELMPEEEQLSFGFDCDNEELYEDD